ncbi:MAG: calcium/proton exchanger [Acidobacteriota bacterium]
MTLSRSLRSFFSDPSRWVDTLIIFVPVAIVLAILHADPTAVFITSALGIVPLAGILGEATDALAHRAGARVGTLLNATFGNAAELIITIAAIRAGLLEVVKASITGSIIGNILLVLGLSVLLGGLKNGFQHFGRRIASVSVTMMAIAVIGLVIPAVFAHAIEERSQLDIEYLSIGVAIALMIGYALNLVFTFTARELRGVPGAPEEIKHLKPGARPTGVQSRGDSEPEHAGWSIRHALVVLAVSVIFIAALSEILVDAIEPLIRQQGLTELFVGVIVVPIIGNAAEHLVAVEMALKNKMEIALGIALGSSMQIALFVGPLLVFISLIEGHPMSLVFNPFELAALAASVVIAALIALDGESNWLEGAQLLIVYVILALAFFYLPQA